MPDTVCSLSAAACGCPDRLFAHVRCTVVWCTRACGFTLLSALRHSCLHIRQGEA